MTLHGDTGKAEDVVLTKSEIDMTNRENWKPIDAETILGAPIQDIGYKVILEDDCRSYAIDDDNKWWVCGFFNGKFCRVEAWPISPELEND